jgi:hypothetical protein
MSGPAEPTPQADLCDKLRAAADRLIGGTPLRSDGKLTIKSLADEAGVKRWLLVNKYPLQLKDKYDAEFRQLTRRSQPSQRADQKIDTLQRQLRQAREDNRRLIAVNKAYAMIIEQLSVDLAAIESGAEHPTVTADVTQLLDGQGVSAARQAQRRGHRFDHPRSGSGP